MFDVVREPPDQCWVQRPGMRCQRLNPPHLTLDSKRKESSNVHYDYVTQVPGVNLLVGVLPSGRVVTVVYNHKKFRGGPLINVGRNSR